MKITSREIIDVLRTVRELGYRQFRLQHEGFQLEASTDPGQAGSAPPARSGVEPSKAGPSIAPPQPGPRQERPQNVSVVSREGLVSITAPMSGTFYRAPAPGAPPFVEVGSTVNANDVVCIIEVMKLFNSIRVSTAGVIAEICAENESPVVAGQPVIWVKPAKP